MTVADRCPGVLRPHRAADGLLIRLRNPGGRTTGDTLAAVAALAQRHGHPEVQLTSRSGLQLRGLPDPLPAGLTAEVAALGFLPSARHDRVRNIVASPGTGLTPGTADLRTMIIDLDRRLIADPRLSELPGRFLFALDDGSGDVAGLPFDLGYRAVTDAYGDLLLGSHRHRIRVPARDAPADLIRLAGDFLSASARSGRGWHVRELPDWVRRHSGPPDPASGPPPVEAPLGAVAGAASVQVPLGLLTQAQAGAIARAAGAGPVVITPWRGVLVPGAAAALPELRAVGLITDRRSGWALVSACVGAPYCARTAVDTRAAATALVDAGVGERVHLSGCERRCGAPSVAHRELVGSSLGELVAR